MADREFRSRDTMATKTTISWEEFLAAGKEDQRWEWVDGEIQFMSPANIRHERVLFILNVHVGNYCEAHPEWIGLASNSVFTTVAENWRMPDLSLVRKDRFPAGELPVRAEFAPDIAFEILSPGNTAAEIQSKRRDYFESRVVQVWIDIYDRSIELIGKDGRSRFFKEDQTLVIDELPGFALQLKVLFAL